jgi:hypothetical protein
MTCIVVLASALLPLIVCVYVLKQMSRSEPDDGAVAELLVSELTADRPLLLPAPALRTAPALEHHVGRYLPDDEASNEQPDATDLPF